MARIPDAELTRMLASKIGQPGARDLKECQEQMGHSNAATFMDRYVHTAQPDIDRERSALDALYDEPDTGSVTHIRKRA